MKKFIFGALIVSILCGGCVVRELIIRSDPPGARVFVDTEEKGVTPCTFNFTFYGSREIVLRKDGFLATKKIVNVPVPWYEYFPIDFISELLIPFYITDTHECDLKLEKIPEQSGSEELIKRAQEISKENAQEK